MVAKGPGSFNGLRVGIAAAKGLAFALHIPVVGISTLEVEAFPFSSYGLPICSLHHLSKEEFAFALYQGEGEKWQNIIPPSIGTLNDICLTTHKKTVFCGEIKDEVKCHIKEDLGDLAVIPGEAAVMRRGGFLAYLGWKRLDEGKVDNMLLLEPLYLRRPKITLKKGEQK
jgi:tRNA threonylcarbamoyladenosine biosynthesis protein TsaB